MMISHIKFLWVGRGDTYFQQLAVLGTAQQKKNNTKEREAEIRGGLTATMAHTMIERGKRGRQQRERVVAV